MQRSILKEETENEQINFKETFQFVEGEKKTINTQTHQLCLDSSQKYNAYRQKGKQTQSAQSLIQVH